MIWKGNFIHFHTQELTESLEQDSNDNNKNNVKKSHFSLINYSIVLKWLICPSIMRMSLDLIDTADTYEKWISKNKLVDWRAFVDTAGIKSSDLKDK